MKKTIILSITLVCVALGTSLSINSNVKIHMSPLAFANIEALTNDETVVCPDHNYVPNEKIAVTDNFTEYVVCVVTGQLSTKGGIIQGDYTVGISYPVVYEVKNCVYAKGACCDQRDVGTFIVLI